jgi:hypothetical protein
MSQGLHQATMRGVGAFGINTEQSLSVEDHRWLTTGKNLVFDSSGRLTSRKGLTPITVTGGHADATQTIHEYITNSTTSEIISAADAKIYSGTTALTDVTGTITTPTAALWNFQNFNGKCIGLQDGHTPIVYSGSSFADITAASGSLPTGGAGLSAFGRLWVSDSNKTTLKWCALLDETHWATGAGSLDTLEVWPDGVDYITSVQEFQGRLLIFGTRSILVYKDPVDPALSAFALEDIIRRGTTWNRSVVSVGKDLLYLSADGLRSVARGLASQAMPLSELSSHLRGELVSQLADATRVDACYSPEDQAYLVRIEQSLSTKYWYFDLSARLETGDLRATEWTGIGYDAVQAAQDGTLYMGNTGGIATHSNYQDDGQPYQVEWMTASTSMDVEGEKILKTAQFSLVCAASVEVVFKWRTDLLSTTYSATLLVECASGNAEWNNADSGSSGFAEWGEAEWSGGARDIELVRVPLSHSGQLVQVGASSEVNGASIAFANVQVLAKVGRLAA